MIVQLVVSAIAYPFGDDIGRIRVKLLTLKIAVVAIDE